MMTHKTPHVGTWEFSATEPWEVLASLLESCCHQEESEDSLQSSGAALGLEFLVLVCRLDLQNYLDQSIADNRLAGDYRPLLASILCPSDSTCWSGRMKQLCRLYCRAVAEKVPALPSVRTLLALAAQLLQQKERTAVSNSQKEEMAKFLAFELQPLELSETELWAQLYLLEPAWLSALVSRELLSLLTNIKLQPVSLRPIMENFLHAIPGRNSNEGKSEMKQPLTVRAINNNEEKSMKPTKSASFPGLPAKTKKKNPAKPSSLPGFPTAAKTIDVHKKNKHGETVLHTAAKKGNIGRLKECLETPGVDINCVDHNGYTPLSEAVSHDKLEVVRLLLNHRAGTQPISNFLTPVKVKASGRENNPRGQVRVDILIRNTNDQSNAFHEAVDLDRVEIVKLILETLKKEQADARSGLPTFAELFEARNGEGKTVMKMATSEEMKQLLAQFSNHEKTKKVGVDLVKMEMTEEMKQQIQNGEQVRVDLVKRSKPSQQVIPRNCGPLIELSLTKYIASNGLASIYKTFHNAKLEDLLSGVNNGKVEVEDKSLDKIEFSGGFKKYQFGVRPRFDLHRSEKIKVQDLRDYGQLINRKDIPEESPISNLLFNLNISK